MKGSSEFLGYGFLNNSGRVEYLTIYTGLQIGFAVYLAISGLVPSFRIPGLVFCVALYSGIIITRIISAIYYSGLTKATFLVGGLELSLCIWGVLLLFQNLK